MRVGWKTTNAPLSSYAGWRARISKKNRRQGTSAPTLAAAWGGPIEMLGALRSLPVFEDVAVDSIVVERESHFDAHGGPRNHDLVAYARLHNGQHVVVCVEAKAGENLGETVEAYRHAAHVKRNRGEATNAAERLRDLLAKYVPHLDPDAESVRLMRYQLLSALAGTEAEATAAGADHAVLMIHEFLTDQRPMDRTAEHMADLRHFCATVLDCEPPDGLQVPWCFQAPAPGSLAANLYIAWAVTDLRRETLEASAPAVS
jgi:hypothetical protein